MPSWLTAEIVIAIMSMFVAILALGTTIWQAKVTQTHNKLTVRPYLSCHVLVSTHQDSAGVYINNDGIGPAIIKAVSFEKNGIVLSLDDFDYKEIFPQLNFGHFHFNIIGIPGSILPGQMQWIFSTTKHKENATLIKDILSSLKGTTLKIEYESIYKESFVFCQTFFPNM
ncbi:hypothetical protein K5M76_20875 [Shewanella xiamenensis]|uniref:hypothetical protein n=1 Tax=Shewanella TaxID=22 RepID=UPI0004D3FE8A|nr:MULTISPECIES: hypothetical protein [Shewanella]KEK28985.1 hypothetical protein SXM_0164 [Shewanella xiamenensis]MCT8858939.1 hypothetical protein [Shewanella xiamenensis]MDN5499464.1 hypothetical protein [Shewanella sp.]MDN5527468.1 hypothetical protein [Shewanella sp.]UWG64564.1 hypothetical protein K5M76_20875 [Shewanella xiamenensis]